VSVLTNEGVKPETFESRQAAFRTTERLERFFDGNLSFGELEGLERAQLDWACSVAHELQEAGDLEAAQKILLALVLLDHRNTLYLCHAAAVTAEMGDPEHALVLLDRAHAAAPQQPMPLVQRAELLLELGQLEEAVADLLLAVELDPVGRDPGSARAQMLLRGVQRAADLRLGAPQPPGDVAEPPADGAAS
jgi:predicted Zn-dependent protease